MHSSALSTAVLLLLAWPGLAQEATPEQVREYARTIVQAQEDLDAGRVKEARERLDSADKAQRGFEYEYLVARTAAAEKGDLVQTIKYPKVETRYGVLDEVDRHVVFICRDGGLRVHDLAKPDAEPKAVATPAGSAIWNGAFSRDCKVFASGHENGDVLVWDPKTWKVRHTVPLGVKWPVRELAVSADGSSFVAEGEKELELWSLADDKPKKVAGIGPRYTFGEGLAFSPTGDQIATGGMFDIIIHDAKTGAETKTMRHASYTMGLEFSPDGKRIASAPRANVNKFLSVFDVATGKSLFIAGPFEQYVAGLAFTPDGKRVVATGPQKDVRLFDATTGTVMLTLKRPDHTAKPAVSRDGRLIGWSEPGGYRFIDLGKKAAK
jgi:WD40 repeat protein